MFYSAKISSIEKLTTDAVNIEFKVESKDLNHFVFKAGQYLVIRIPALNASEHRSYSISAAPFENKIQIGVKKQANGLVSSYLCNQIKVGETVEIMSPAGSFILNENQSYPKIVAFAAGSGITPIMAMIKHQLKNSSSSIHLFFGNKDAHSIMYKSQLDTLVNDHPTRFEINYVYSQQKIGLVDLEGRIDANKIKRWATYLFSPKETSAFLLCGPGDMVQSIQASLLTSGVSQDKILTEYFTSPSKDNAAPQTEFKSTAAVEGFNIKIKYEGKFHQLQSPNNKTVILDMGLKQGLDLPYSCKSGVCSTCQAKLISGKVKMDNNYVLSESELNDGFILTCQSHAITPNVEVDYDVR